MDINMNGENVEVVFTCEAGARLASISTEFYGYSEPKEGAVNNPVYVPSHWVTASPNLSSTSVRVAVEGTEKLLKLNGGIIRSDNCGHMIASVGAFGHSGMVWELSKYPVGDGKAYMSLYLGGYTFDSEVFMKASITDTIQDLEIELNNGRVFFEHTNGNVYSYEVLSLEDNSVQAELHRVQGEIVEVNDVSRTHENLGECLKHLKEQEAILW